MFSFSWVLPLLFFSTELGHVDSCYSYSGVVASDVDLFKWFQIVGLNMNPVSWGDFSMEPLLTGEELEQGSTSPS